MRIQVLREAGLEEALLGLSLSYSQPPEKMLAVARRLARRDDGSNKFLESIAVWLDVTAPRYWWQQFDTYRVGVSKQSESTMHTILRRPLSPADFAGAMPPETLQRLNRLIEQRDLEAVKRELPEGFLQRRIVCTNYKALRHMVQQRHNHRLPEWRFFCAALQEQLAHPEFLAERLRSGRTTSQRSEQ